jgi:hypothetical protein
MKATHASIEGNCPGGYGSYRVTIFAGSVAIASQRFQIGGYGNEHVDAAYAKAKAYAASFGVS